MAHRCVWQVTRRHEEEGGRRLRESGGCNNEKKDEIEDSGEEQSEAWGGLEAGLRCRVTDIIRKRHKQVGRAARTESEGKCKARTEDRRI